MPEEAVLTIGFAPGTPVATVVEILVALDTIHRELAGYPLRVAGEPREGAP